MFDRCDLCGVSARGLCGGCRRRLDAPTAPDLRPEVDAVFAVFGYVGVGAELLRKVKFSSTRRSVAPLVAAIAEAIEKHAVTIDVLVPVPPSRQRVRARGFSLPDIVSRRLGRALGVRVVRPLRRPDDGAQHERSGAERRASAAFESMHTVRGTVLLVDDVVTTGATLRACAAALRMSGSTSIVAAVLATTPESGSGVSPHGEDRLRV